MTTVSASRRRHNQARAHTYRASRQNSYASLVMLKDKLIALKPHIVDQEGVNILSFQFCEFIHLFNGQITETMLMLEFKQLSKTNINFQFLYSFGIQQLRSLTGVSVVCKSLIKTDGNRYQFNLLISASPIAVRRQQTALTSAESASACTTKVEQAMKPTPTKVIKEQTVKFVPASSNHSELPKPLHSDSGITSDNQDSTCSERKQQRTKATGTAT